jgi:hypothetical protein
MLQVGSDVDSSFWSRPDQDSHLDDNFIFMPLDEEDGPVLVALFFTEPSWRGV